MTSREKLRDVNLLVFFEADELRQHVKRGEDCKCLATAGTQDAFSRKRLKKESSEKQAGVSMRVLFFTKKHSDRSTGPYSINRI